MSNLCRDESCMILEDKIESVFGSCFSTHGLGGVLTCGVIGMCAGLSHSPVENVSDKYGICGQCADQSTRQELQYVSSAIVAGCALAMPNIIGVYRPQCPTCSGLLHCDQKLFAL